MADRAPVRVIEQSAGWPDAPDLFEPKLEGGRGVIELPAHADEVMAAGGGRYLVVHLKSIHSLAVVDLCNAMIAHVIEMPSGENHVAAGIGKLYVSSNARNTITRYDLATCEMELTVLAPDGGVQSMCMGCASVWPLVVASGRKTFLYDPQTFRAEPINWDHWGTDGDRWPAPSLRISADGRTLVAFGGGYAGVEMADIDGLKIGQRRSGADQRGPEWPVRISWSGAFIFTTHNTVQNHDLTPAPIELHGYGIAALSPNYMLSLQDHRAHRDREAKPTLRIYLAAGNQRVAQFNELPEVPWESSLPFEQRIWYLPAAKLLATVGDGNRRIFLRRVDPIEGMNKWGIDYLLVTSVPGPIAVRGSRYAYSMQTQSKRGGVRYLLSSGPRGMLIAADGTLRWDVPLDFSDDRVEVIVSVKDSSGQKVFHTFTIQIRNRAPLAPHPNVGPKQNRA